MSTNDYVLNLRFVKHLGSGQFGSVEKGLCFNRGQKVRVALKILKQDASGQDRVKFLQEAVIMTQLNHNNVIKLLGTVLDQNPVSIVCQFPLTRHRT